MIPKSFSETLYTVFSRFKHSQKINKGVVMKNEQQDFRPTPEHPLLIGLMIDVSGSMMSSIQNRSGRSLNRLQSFQNSLDDLIFKAKDLSQEETREKIAPLLKLFAYGFGFGNPLSFLFGGTGAKVRDLLDIAGEPSSTITIDRLANNWVRYRSHVENLATQMFGDTPMGDAFNVVQKRFELEMKNKYSGQPVLFVLSDGDPTDSSADKIIQKAAQIKSNGIIIVSCYVTDKDITEPRKLYGVLPNGWPSGAKLMFQCASKLSEGSPFYSYLKEYNWMIEQEGRFFAQINQSEILTEFMNALISPLMKQDAENIQSVAKREDNIRNKVFISYSHADREWLNRLKIHLKPLERKGIIEICEDTKIRGGAKWKEEIAKALNSTKVALLLISADFLSSDFISTVELPQLLQAAENDGAIVIPVILKPSRFDKEPELSKFQAINDSSEPLISLPETAQEQIFVKLTNVIESYV